MNVVTRLQSAGLRATPKRIAIGGLLFDGMTIMDFIGIYDPLRRLKTMNIVPDFEWNVCARGAEVVDENGLRVKPDSVDQSLSGYDLLVVPGGMGTRKLQHDAGFIEWLKTAEGAKIKASVCTGALLLAKAGLLDGLSATTHHGALDLLREVAPNTTVRDDLRVVDNGRVITSAGVASGIDMSFHVVAKLLSPEVAQATARYIEYPWQAA